MKGGRDERHELRLLLLQGRQVLLTDVSAGAYDPAGAFRPRDRSDVEADVEDVAVLDHVVLALEARLAAR